MIVLFKNDDVGYQNWLRENQAGYVFSDFWGTNNALKTLHNAGCRLLHSPANTLHWTNTSKVCSINLDELLDWLDRNRNSKGQGYSPCEVCRPFYPKENPDDAAWDCRPSIIIWR